MWLHIQARIQTISRNPKTERKNPWKKDAIWFNPPFSLNVVTNVGKEFSKLVDKHVPRGKSLYSIINRQTVKIGYKCLLNMEHIT